MDHDGRDDTRVFNEVTATNEALAALTPVCGSLPKADAAMIFDWDNRWAAQLHGGTVKVVDDTRGADFEIILPKYHIAER